MTFEEYQTVATRVPLSLRNNRDRILFPVSALQEEAEKIGSLLTAASASSGFSLTEEQRNELRNRLSDVLWHVALLCEETGIGMQDVAANSAINFRRELNRLVQIGDKKEIRATVNDRC